MVVVQEVRVLCLHANNYIPLPDSAWPVAPFSALDAAYDGTFGTTRSINGRVHIGEIGHQNAIAGNGW